MKKILLITMLLSVSFINAQETIFDDRTVYKTEESYGFVIHTTGWGVNYRYGKYTSGFTRKIYEGEIVGIKHPKEKKSFSPFFDNTNGFVFGKTNSIILFRGSVGWSNTFIPKQSVRGIAISYVLNAGFSIAYAKPVYLEILTTNDQGEIISKVERFDFDRHQQQNILGKAPLLKGLFRGRFYPGATFKGGLNFESSKQADRINSIEVGLALDVYLQELPIFANELNSRFLYNLYVKVAFGSKKTGYE